MGSEQRNALEAIRWGTDYLLKATSVPDVVVGVVGDPHADHNCWERPKDMDTPKTMWLTKQVLVLRFQPRLQLHLQPLP